MILTEYTYKPTDYEIKLIILYAVKSLKVGASYTMLDYVISSSANVNYFELEQYIDSLLLSGNLSEIEADGDKIFSITDVGEETLGFFSNKIPGSIMARLDEKISSVNGKEAIGNSVSADFFPVSENEYAVKFSVEEGGTPLLEFEMYAGSKERAKNICRYLKANAADFYAKINKIIDEGLSK